MFIKKHLKRNRSLKSVTTFGVGGVARYYITVSKVQEMEEIAEFIQNESIPFYVIGKGSNSLFDDRGFDGLVILNKIDFLNMNEKHIKVGSGYSFSLLGIKTARRGWGGLEFASGIPGTVGGAVYMNAGANGGETQEYLTSVTYIDLEKGLVSRKKEELIFSYRTSSFQSMKVIIISAEFSLIDKSQARKNQLDIIEYRKVTQPYGQKSAGCVFRNPNDISAGALIEQCGLKGKRIGDAVVSLKHGNFIVNEGNASAQDILQLIQLLQKEIKEKTGRNLETEISLVPYRMGEKGV